MNDLNSKLSPDELQYMRLLATQKQSIDAAYTHWVLYLKDKYNIPSGQENIDSEGNIVAKPPKKEVPAPVKLG